MVRVTCTFSTSVSFGFRSVADALSIGVAFFFLPMTLSSFPDPRSRPGPTHSGPARSRRLHPSLPLSSASDSRARKKSFGSAQGRGTTGDCPRRRWRGPPRGELRPVEVDPTHGPEDGAPAEV